MGQIGRGSSLCLPNLKEIHAKLKKLLKDLRGLFFLGHPVYKCTHILYSMCVSVSKLLCVSVCECVRLCKCVGVWVCGCVGLNIHVQFRFK